MKKEIFQNNNVTIEVREHNPNNIDFWVQSGQVGIILQEKDMRDMHELVGLIIEEFLGAK